MKLLHIISLLVVGLFFAGCASSNGSQAATDDESSETGETEQVRDKTAYDGSTGSGLLMERYKTGQIVGYRD